jgi:hypothetical protein
MLLKHIYVLGIRNSNTWNLIPYDLRQLFKNLKTQEKLQKTIANTAEDTSISYGAKELLLWVIRMKITSVD